ncbi:hypothetical protein [Actinomadura formosensis]|uniref:hypothetical protein n=1 Tax=Actinomadura formosensis TaxID=60706 RepID=UPI003D89C237
MPATIHAGEANGTASIRQAIELLHARRVGHGVSLGDRGARRHRTGGRPGREARARPGRHRRVLPDVQRAHGRGGDRR